FFFSSRRRHTRFSRDWSSDVCSSDLRSSCPEPSRRVQSRKRSGRVFLAGHRDYPTTTGEVTGATSSDEFSPAVATTRQEGRGPRSEERRVGKERRCEWSRGS